MAPISAGTVQKDDVLVTNFNNSANLQGVGSTIIDYNPTTKKMSVFAKLPRDLAGCPGGVGLSTAMTMLKSGWVIVGSAPSTDGTTKTKGAGCLVVLDSQGKVAGTIAGDMINMPWGNMAVIDKGDTATLFVSNAGFDVGSPEGEPPVVNEATVLRIELSIPSGKPPTVVSQTVIGSGFGAQADKDVFLIGPTGLALGKDGTLYVSDASGNRINAIWDATTRDHSGRHRPGSDQGRPAEAPAGHDDRAERAPAGRQRAERAGGGDQPGDGRPDRRDLDRSEQGADAARSGDLFGIAMTPSGDGFYYVEDEVNTLVLAR